MRRRSFSDRLTTDETRERHLRATVLQLEPGSWDRNSSSRAAWWTCSPLSAAGGAPRRWPRPEPPPHGGSARRCSAARRVRGVREGAADRSTRVRVRLLEAALAKAPTLRSHPPGAVGARTNALGEHARALAAWKAIRAGHVAAPQVAGSGPRSSLIELRRYDEAFSTLRALADARPERRGLEQPRRRPVASGWTAADAAAPTYYFNKAAELEPDDADLFFNLGYAYWDERDAQAAIYWLREALRRNPADADAHFVLAAALEASGAASRPTRERALAQQLSARYTEAGEAQRVRVPRGLERIEDSLLAAPSDAVRRGADGGGPAQPAGARQLPPGAREAALRAAQRWRRGARAPARPVPVAVPRGGAPAHRPHLPAFRPAPRRHRGLSHRALERGIAPRRTWRSPKPCSRRTIGRRAAEVQRALAARPGVRAEAAGPAARHLTRPGPR